MGVSTRSRTERNPKTLREVNEGQHQYDQSHTRARTLHSGLIDYTSTTETNSTERDLVEVKRETRRVQIPHRVEGTSPDTFPRLLRRNQLKSRPKPDLRGFLRELVVY